jgi:hypothetical protein
MFILIVACQVMARRGCEDMLKRGNREILWTRGMTILKICKLSKRTPAKKPFFERLQILLFRLRRAHPEDRRSSKCIGFRKEG